LQFFELLLLGNKFEEKNVKKNRRNNARKYAQPGAKARNFAQFQKVVFSLFSIGF